MKYLFLLLIITFYSCGNKQRSHHAKVIVIQPLGKISADIVNAVYKEMVPINPNIVLNAAIPLPDMAYYQPRNRYRADSLLRFLNKYKDGDTVVIGLTSRDISTTKNEHKDWGIMGLGYTPGNACVASTFRVNKQKEAEQFYKVSIHELGHTEGLPHCPVKSCFMRNANGGRPLHEETDFCKSCKAFLIKKGWILK